MSILTEKEEKEFKGYEFPFENFVLEGGGAKLFGGVGTIMVLEELGVLQKMTRFAGTSAGALLAALLALGYNSKEIEELMQTDMNRKIRDEYTILKPFQYLYNIMTYFGFHKGHTLETWLGELVAKKTGNPDTTFWELYNDTGNELAVTATDLLDRRCVYYHVKTSPSYRIREAVYSSMSLPGLLRPDFHEDDIKNKQILLDGGLKFNYPVNMFDGWNLSPGEENDFITKALKEDDSKATRWGTRNDKTIGLVVYSTDDKKTLKNKLKKRVKEYIKHGISENPQVPDTNLTKERNRHSDAKAEADFGERKLAKLRKDIAIAMDNDINVSEVIKIVFDDNFSAVYNTPNDMLRDTWHFTDKDADLLEKGATAKSTLEKAKEEAKIRDKDYCESVPRKFTHSMVKKSESSLQLLCSLDLHGRTYKPERIDNLKEFLVALTSLFGKVQEHEDYDRTIGVNTSYITTLDFKTEHEDKKYLIEESKVACLAFLHEYIKENKLEKQIRE